MPINTDAAYGSWKSPVTSERIAGQAVGFQEICADGKDLYWLENRPKEQGRTALVFQKSGHPPLDLITDANIRTRVHEYGGGAFTVFNGTVYYIDDKDRSLYMLGNPHRKPVRIVDAGNRRFADFAVSPDEKFLICVCEEHRDDGHVANFLIHISLEKGHTVQTISEGHDFYSSPRISPKGKQLAWVTWDHPNMPWDDSQLWIAEIQESGRLKDVTPITSQSNESVTEPSWSPQGILHFISDRTGWWNLYRCTGNRIEPLCPMEAEFSLPPWIFGRHSYAFFPHSENILCTYSLRGMDHLGVLIPDEKRLDRLDFPYTVIRNVCIGEEHCFFFGASPKLPLSLVQWDMSSKEPKILRQSFNSDLDESMISIPEEIIYPSTSGRQSYAFYYPPRNGQFVPPSTQLPPLLVKCHGGPTAHVQTALNLETQYWTSRGFAVLEVNYGGSSGYGRTYRKVLEGNWGIIDVEDCIQGALHLANSGKVDRNRLLIKGGSAGGYTVLCALAFHDVFAAATSLYGVSDLELLAKDTHKFESHYLDRLIGPYPKDKKTYVERSPIHHIQNLHRPVLLLQGREDPVVPLGQAESIFQALKQKGTPVALIVFEKEQHGFRRAETIKRALDAELDFYSQILKFPLPQATEPLIIENIVK